MKSISLFLFLVAASLIFKDAQALCDEVPVNSDSPQSLQNPCGSTKSHSYTNPDGSAGGWVNDLAEIEPTVFIAPSAKVCSKSKLKGQTVIGDNTSITGPVKALGWVLIRDTVITGTVNADGSDGAVMIRGASISGKATLVGRHVFGVTIDGNLNLSGELKMFELSRITGTPSVSGKLFMHDSAQVMGNPVISGVVHLYDSTVFGGTAIVKDKKELRLSGNNSKLSGTY